MPLRIFSFSELKVATRNFRQDTVLGEGGFGKVYKGWLEKANSRNGSGSVVAIKRLTSGSLQGLTEWQSEVNVLGRLSHPNLVKLLGFCLEKKEQLIVYEFMQKGSLEDHLFGRGSAVQPLPWDLRIKVLIGAARGLAFLHKSKKQVIYRDFKASNILLDGSYNAKLSDFGLAKMGPSAGQSHVTTRVMGTYGYAAPEYVATGHLYVKSDVYGFGVVLVEMLTGLRALDTKRPSWQHNLVEWAKPFLANRRKLKNIMDSRLEGKYPSKAAVLIAQLALTCLVPEPRTRPPMEVVVETLILLTAWLHNITCHGMGVTEEKNKIGSMEKTELEKSREEQKLGNEEKPATTWNPTFRSEDFMEDGQGQPSRVVHASPSKGEKGGKHDEKEKEGDGLDLKLSLYFVYSRNRLGKLEPEEPPRHGSASWTPTLRRVINLVVTAIIVFITLLNIFVYKLRQLHEENSGNQVRPSAYFTEHLCRQFSLADIQLATRNFDDALVIGQGGFGKVYRGVIDNGTTTVAIKRLSSMSRQGAPQFWTEIEMLSKFRHSHLVSLIGYCDNVHEMILVYEYILLGSLADHLHKRDRSNKSPLSWVQRLKICIGAARGLDYLHTGTGFLHRVIHRDVKSSNILLGENWAAKIADFGMSRLGPANQSCSHVSTDVKGTFGYMDPEYYLTRRLTRKSDVYAFGVVLFEVLCGRPAVDMTLDEEQWGLAVWAKYCIKEGILDQSIDPSLRGKISPDCLIAVVKIAEQCLHNLPMKRPTMAEVMVQLEYALALQERTTDSPVIEKAFPVIADTVDSSLLEEIVSNTGGSSGIQDNNAEPSAVQEIRKPASRKTFTRKVRQFLSVTARMISDTVLGVGGFGTVYKGWLEKANSSNGSGSVVAIKRLNSESLQGLEEWQEKELLLVYEFMPKGSLEVHLFRRGSDYRIPWDLRIKVLIGAARGLAFLHASEKQVIYRDFKASNILLDGTFNAKLSDFGLAKMGPSAGESHLSTRVMGTYGYAAPEYVATGHLYVKSDVYGFGVVLVEMLTGLRALDTNRPSGQQNLVEWAKPFLANRRKLKNIMDSRLKGKYPSKAAVLIAQLALTCLVPEPRTRPPMEVVVETLKGEQSLLPSSSAADEKSLLSSSSAADEQSLLPSSSAADEKSLLSSSSAADEQSLLSSSSAAD
ncbi:hypothetical protein RJ640_017261, partial [Escallonia rubra]